MRVIGSRSKNGKPYSIRLVNLRINKKYKDTGFSVVLRGSNKYGTSVAVRSAISGDVGTGSISDVVRTRTNVIRPRRSLNPSKRLRMTHARSNLVR